MQRASGSRAVVRAVLCIYTIKHGYTGCIWVAMLILSSGLWWYAARGCGVSFGYHAPGWMRDTRSGNGLLRLPPGFLCTNQLIDLYLDSPVGVVAVTVPSMEASGFGSLGNFKSVTQIPPRRPQPVTLSSSTTGSKIDEHRNDPASVDLLEDSLYR